VKRRPLNADQRAALSLLQRGWPWALDGRTARSFLVRSLIVIRPHVLNGAEVQIPVLTEAGAALAVELFGPPPSTDNTDEEPVMSVPPSRPAFNFPATDRLLRRADIEAEVRLSRATIGRRVKDGTFPPPIDYGPQCKRWPASWLAAWKTRGADWRSALVEAAEK
jgi:predicted DNA-binding transcriptional regulator AlpA